MKTNNPDINNKSFTNVFIAQEGKYIKIFIEDILYASSLGNQINIHTLSEVYTVRMSLNKLLCLLPDEQYMKVHKQYIIQISAIEVIDKKENIILIGSGKIPIGRSYKSNLIEKINIIN